MKSPALNDDSSPFFRLPDETVFQILKKLIDFKTICNAELVSKRFYEILSQIDTISFIVPPTKPSNSDGNFSQVGASFLSESFWSVIKSMTRFSGLKYLRIELPFSNEGNDNDYLFKWKVSFSNKIDSFVFLSPNSICNMNELLCVNENVDEEEEEEDDDLELSSKKHHFAFGYMMEAMIRFRMMLICTVSFPLLEKVLVTDSSKTGTISASVSDGKIGELRKWIDSDSSTEIVTQMMGDSVDLPSSVSDCYIPLLKLPVSGYVMKGVNLILFERDGSDYDSIMKIVADLDDDLEDKEEVVYSEALREIFKKHRGRIQRRM